MKFSGAKELGVQLKQDLQDIRQVINEHKSSG
jgi:hypothetical protein